MWKKVLKLLGMSFVSISSAFVITNSYQTKYTKPTRTNYVKKAWEDTGKNISQALKRYERENN